MTIWRAIRSAFRRAFYPNGPWWFGLRHSSVTLMMALGDDFPTAVIKQVRLDTARLSLWLDGF